MASMVVVVAAALFVVMAMAMAGSSNAAVAEHTFVVSQVRVRHQLVTVVNGQLPGPTIEVMEGDTVVAHVVNQSPFGVTIHWHGVRQLLNCWADGTGMVTQCPIASNASFTYRFEVGGHEGTLWWHAHTSSLRATLHGLIIIRPNSGGSYPSWYPKQPDEEVPIVIADFVHMDDLTQLETVFYKGANAPSSPTINGRLGDLYNCSGGGEDNFVLEVQPGKTYMLRLVNAALFNDYYFKVAGHKLIVVGADANYVRPYTAADGVVAVAAGETLDVLMVADAPPGQSYYMVALGSQEPEPEEQLPVVITRGIVQYPANGGKDVVEPIMPDQHDTRKSFQFHANLRGRPDHPSLPQLRGRVHDRLFITVGMGTIASSVDVASMNNVSFRLPEGGQLALLEARYHGAAVPTEELPAMPPRVFDFTDPALIPVINRSKTLLELQPTRQATTTRRFAYNSTVELVFQSTSLMESDGNPMHLHGHDMFVLAQGHGNYDAARDVAAYNLVDPPAKNTVMVPGLGWTAVRFIANNPGAWLLHCHYEFHNVMGMSTIFEVANGPTQDTALPPPPADLPRCNRPAGSSFAYK